MQVFRSKIRHMALGSAQTKARVYLLLVELISATLSRVCLKAIGRANNSGLKVKISHIVHYTVLFRNALRHLKFLLYVF